MTDSKFHTSESAPADSMEGRTFRPTTREELAEAVELAFDFRGDITLELATGRIVEGYLFNRLASGLRPSVQIFPKDQEALIEIPYADLVSIAFTGKDTASGKSWEAWVAKKDSQRKAEAAQVEAEARARGHL